MKAVRLSEIFSSLESGSRPKGGIIDGEGDVPSLGAEHLDGQGGFNFSKLKRIPRDYFSSMTKGIIRKGDILIVKDGATTGKVSFVHEQFPFEKASINEHVFSLRLDEKRAFQKYIFWHLQSPKGQQQILRDFRGATVGGISRGFMDKVKLPLPPLNEQCRIAAILDKADAIRRKRQESISLTEEFLRSVFLDMFGDPVTNPKGWDKAPIKELGTVMTGNTPLRAKPEYYGDGIEWIKSDNINTPNHFLTEAKERLTSEGQKLARIVPKKSILVTCIAGSPECIGNAAIADRTVAFNQQINAVTSFEGVDPYFFYVQILVAKNLIQKQSTESMKGMVSKGKFENILLLKPPYPLQEKFGKIFNKFHDAFRKNNEALSESNNLFGVITQKAFKGEL